MSSSATKDGYDYSLDESTVRRSADSYNIQDKKIYEEEVSSGIPAPIEWKGGPDLLTYSLAPLVVLIDDTGSLGESPKLMFKKSTVLYNECKVHIPEALRSSFEISFGAVGDANSDAWPLQIGKFGQETMERPELRNILNSIKKEHGGGGQGMETYELDAYYYARHCQMPKALKPILVFVGDESFYKNVSAYHVKNLIGDHLEKDLSSYEIFDELQKKFATYILRIDCSGHYDQATEEKAERRWRKALVSPDKHVLHLEDPARITDSIIGIVAAEYGDWDHFKERISKRQTPEQVEQVFETLNPVEVKRPIEIHIHGGNVIIGDNGTIVNDSAIVRSNVGGKHKHKGAEKADSNAWNYYIEGEEKKED